MSWTWGLSSFWGQPSPSNEQNTVDAQHTDNTSLDFIQNILDSSSHTSDASHETQGALNAPTKEHHDDHALPIDQSSSTGTDMVTNDHQMPSHYLDHIHGVISSHDDSLLDDEDAHQGHTLTTAPIPPHTTTPADNDDDQILSGFRLVADDDDGDDGDHGDDDDDLVGAPTDYTTHTNKNKHHMHDQPKHAVGVLKTSRFRRFLGRDDDLVGNKFNKDFVYRNDKRSVSSTPQPSLNHHPQPHHQDKDKHGSAQPLTNSDHNNNTKDNARTIKPFNKDRLHNYRKNQSDFEKRYNQRQHTFNWEVEQEDLILEDMSHALERLYMGSNRIDQQLHQQEELIHTSDQLLTTNQSHFDRLDYKIEKLLKSNGMRKVHIIIIQVILVLILAIMILYT